MRTQGNSFLSSGAQNEHQARVLEGVAIWAAYYRSNIHRFVEDYFHIRLKLFQIFLLYMMDRCTTLVFIACRGLGKTFLSAVFCCARCVLRPGTKICIASGTRGQAINVLEKIIQELRPLSAELANEIDNKETKITGADAKIVFRNGSYIKVVTSNDNARGNRANILILDEFRLIKKDVIDTILKKFMSGPRHPKYLDRPEYKNQPELWERNKTLYLSSAYYKDHWSYTRCKDSCRMMLDDKRANFVCGLPYQLAIQEDLLLEDEVIEQMSESDFNEIKWLMEMCAEFWGDSDGSFYKFDVVAKNRRIEYAMLPGRIAAKLPSASNLRIPPKVPGEKRILSADIALMATTKHKNDAAAIFINQLVPTKAGRYTNNIVYTESNEGFRTDAEALTIRKLYDEFDCDYIVLDTRNVGLSVYDALATDITDPETGEIYPALSCCNNADMAARCTNRNAERVIWSVTGNSKFNSDCALLLREGLRSGRIRLLVTEYDAESILGEIKGFGSLSIAERTELTMPYINTTLLISELINLRHEESAGLVRVSEKAGMRKDRYSSLSYNFWVANQIEKDIQRNEFDLSTDSTLSFVFRAPKNRSDDRW